MKKVLLLSGILLSVILGFALTHDSRDAKDLGPNPAPAAEVHGELIQPPALAVSNGEQELPTNKPPARKHPKPASVQIRMVLAQFAPSDPAGTSGAAIPSGTLGTAADLAKTNLISAASLPPISEQQFGCPEVSFRTLSDFDLRLSKEMTAGAAASAQTAADVRAQIPPAVLAFDGKKVVIQGFLLPVKMDDGLAVEFLLMRNQSMCCYGVPPKINEWLTVQMTGKGVKPVMDQPMAVTGTLHVGAILENGSLAGIYRLDGDKAIGP